MTENEYAEIDVKTIHKTDDAVCFYDGDKEFWVPISLMEDWPDMGESGTALVEIWFAEDKELI